MSHNIRNKLHGNVFSHKSLYVKTKGDTMRVRTAIERLPVEFQEILLLRKFEELFSQAFATVLNCLAEVVTSCFGSMRSRLWTSQVEGWNKLLGSGRIV
jgi:RNA polymerase sigma-70 factor, ECF subfamily